MRSWNAADRLEDGVFGLEAVKLGGPGAKTRGVGLTRNRFRVIVAAIVLFAIFAVLALRERGRAECEASQQSVQGHLEESRELMNRLLQRNLFDEFLDAEKALEHTLLAKTKKNVVRKLLTERLLETAGAERATALFQAEVQHFTGQVDAAVEEIIGPLDAAFKDIPQRLLRLDEALGEDAKRLRTKCPHWLPWSEPPKVVRALAAAGAAHKERTAGEVEPTSTWEPIRTSQGFAELADWYASLGLEHKKRLNWYGVPTNGL